jgi:hypothetical protein
VARWLSHEDAELGFRIKYPPDWEYVDQGFDSATAKTVKFRPKDLHNDWAISISVIQDGAETAGDWIAGSGSQFGTDRYWQYDAVRVDDARGTRAVLVTCSFPDWYDEMIVLEHSGRTYFLDNGAVREKMFEPFYRSLQFIAEDEGRDGHD